MSVISPLLDTLLHQVLGRRADLDRVAARPMQQPLGAVTYTPPPRHATSDTPEEHQTPANGQSPVQRQRPAVQELQSGVQEFRAAEQGVNASTRQHFSPEARTIAAILARFPTREPMVQGAAPLISDARLPTIGLLAHALGREVALSGLFYEAHLARWTQGRLDRQGLQHEPQSALMAMSKDSPKAGNGQEESLNRSATSAAGTAGTIVHHDAQSLLRQQLELMASGIFRWNGEVWPDVPMQWEIEEQQQGRGDESPSSWSTRLYLEMPVLGPIEFRLTLTGQHLQVRGINLSSDTAQRLEEGGESLQQRLTDAGFSTTLPSFTRGEDH
ncbi:hypothetical protein C7446_0996 [Kushneria sinocarnis]|uniref:Flagellar hook-length control protein-like C-terminal domain-containing protein n=1 Tax=Kushneria sinocarnis TaxID=595502 RepID=A0A420WY31_9GAMM|nr:flagellar hook-length control protein FliK [Kushneria sinocarnis]RKR06060.1 hypothetical protein C7446_0996 [Kushneria sinocarnis]